MAKAFMLVERATDHAQLVVGEATKMRLDSLTFSAGESVGKDPECLSALSQLLRICQQLSLMIFPVANGSDWMLGYGSDAQQEAAIEAFPEQRAVLKYWLKSARYGLKAYY
tara:strand:+ start:3716 stop:4048 length:333 start_codon:yes stop_codon:yes gene_type:complete